MKISVVFSSIPVECDDNTSYTYSHDYFIHDIIQFTVVSVIVLLDDYELINFLKEPVNTHEWRVILGQ